METQQIYEKIMMEYSFNKLKHLRNQWNGDDSIKKMGIDSLIDIKGGDHRQYEYIMNSGAEIVLEMLKMIVTSLIKTYDIPVKYYDLRTEQSDVYFIGENELWRDHIDQHKTQQVLAFSRTDQQPDLLFVFKEFGGSKRIPRKTLDELMKAAKLKRICYVSFVESEAYAEVINHSKDENDPTRGTGIFSFRQFIEGFFGKEEYIRFRKYSDTFSKKTRDYFGFALVRTLQPNTILNFKKEVRDTLKEVNAIEIGAGNVSEGQRCIIEKNFLSEANYEILLGSSDFAQSYMTAEWLYASLSNAGNIDLTAVAMGYFKAIEQLLYAFLKIHTFEKDGVYREVFVGKDKSYANAYGNAQLTDELIHNPEKVKDLTLGSLTGFFGYHDSRRNRYYKRNNDLLAAGIDNTTYEFIIDVFGGIVGLRNGYFHKDNLNDWNKVNEARKNACLVFYLLLGGYSLSDAEKIEMGLIPVDDHDDFYKLCAYVNKKSYESTSMFEFPIVYINDINNPYAFGYPYHDDFIEYDNYGEPVYSGVYFKEFGKDGHIIKVDRNHLPREIWEGVFIISESVPIKAEPSGAQKLIFRDGKFTADAQNN